MLTTPIMILF